MNIGYRPTHYSLLIIHYSTNNKWSITKFMPIYRLILSVPFFFRIFAF